MISFMGYFEDAVIDLLIDDKKTENKFLHNHSCHSQITFKSKSSHTVMLAPYNNSERGPLTP